MNQNMRLLQKKKMTTPNTRYFSNLNQIGCDFFEKATSISRFTSLLKAIGLVFNNNGVAH